MVTCLCTVSISNQVEYDEVHFTTGFFIIVHNATCQSRTMIYSYSYLGDLWYNNKCNLKPPFKRFGRNNQFDLVS